MLYCHWFHICLWHQSKNIMYTILQINISQLPSTIFSSVKYSISWENPKQVSYASQKSFGLMNLFRSAEFMQRSPSLMKGIFEQQRKIRSVERCNLTLYSRRCSERDREHCVSLLSVKMKSACLIKLGYQTAIQ